MGLFFICHVVSYFLSLWQQLLVDYIKIFVIKLRTISVYGYIKEITLFLQF